MLPSFIFRGYIVSLSFPQSWGESLAGETDYTNICPETAAPSTLTAIQAVTQMKQFDLDLRDQALATRNTEDDPRNAVCGINVLFFLLSCTSYSSIC